VMWGAQDKLIVPAYAARWEKSIAKVRVQMIDGAGHMVPYEQPDAFVQAVGAFLG
jgi:pimeloyl-ACP methyl ester carboxylesterase